MGCIGRCIIACDARPREAMLRSNAMIDSAQVRSAFPGMVWPGLPADPGARLLGLLFQLDQTQWWSPEQILDHQLEQAARLLRHARDTVPFYEGRLAGLEVGEEFDLEAYRRIPLLTRSEIQEAGRSIASRAVPTEHAPLMKTESSGSTGQPVVQIGTQVTNLFWQALLMRDHLWQRRDFSGMLAAIRSKTESATMFDWGPPANLVFQTGPCAILELSIDLDEQIRWLQRQDPVYVISFATNIYHLARRCRELGVRFSRLREARTYGEMLHPDLRTTVREAWGVEVVDSYSSEELGYIALQCPGREQYHVQAENLLVEVLRPDGSSCSAGEIGRVVVTTLHNFAMPLVRYANGDYAEVGNSCPCGRGLPVFNRIVGRQRNMLVRPDGVRHWPSLPSEIYRPVAPVQQLQMVQDARDHIEVRLVLPRELMPEEESGLKEAFRKCLGYPFRFTLRRVDAVERNAGAKFEDFICRVAD
jgi:phenylacetate-coenzyme A ligase PaaK-like adenylate-forming protein